MTRTILTVMTVVALQTSPLPAQTFQECADVNDDGRLSVTDITTMMRQLIGSDTVIVPGRGDIDFRQGWNTGDVRYLSGYLMDVLYPEGGCPPFAPYSPVPTNDTLLLPKLVIPTGSGTFDIPIYFITHSQVGEMSLPLMIEDYDGTVKFDSLVPGPPFPPGGPYDIAWHTDSTAGLIFSSLNGEPLAPGMHVMARAYFSFNCSPRDSVRVSPATLGPSTFLNYVFGDYNSPDYSTMAVGVPTVVITDVAGSPTISTDVDTIYWEAVGGDPQPESLPVQVLSGGGSFEWFAVTPTWIGVFPTAGMSGTSVEIIPYHGKPPGIYYGNVEFHSTEALGSPATVTIVLEVDQPLFDANCDGVYNTADLIEQVNYMFKSDSLPCDPRHR